jgi:hypothetical protein
MTLKNNNKLAMDCLVVLSCLRYIYFFLFRTIVEPKFGPMPTFPNQRIYVRAVMILATLLIVYFTSKNQKETILASQKELIQGRGQNFPCSAEYIKDLKVFPGK